MHKLLLSCLLCSKIHKLVILHYTDHFNVFDSKSGALSSIDHYTEINCSTSIETNGTYLVSICKRSSVIVSKVSTSGFFFKFVFSKSIKAVSNIHQLLPNSESHLGSIFNHALKKVPTLGLCCCGCCII